MSLKIRTEKEQIAAFWAKVSISSDVDKCWNWTGYTSKGYGRMTWNGHMERVHRISWMLAHGEIPVGLNVLHQCDNRKCVNPKHLFLGTHQDNMADRDAKGRQVHQSNENHPRHKLTDSQVRNIRQLHVTENISQTELAKQFGVSQGNIWSIIHHKSRKKG